MTTRPRIACCILVSLTCYLSACVASHGPAPARVVRAKVVADDALRERNPRWASAVKRVVEGASDYFENEFGIRIVPQSVTPWSGTGNLSSTAHLMTRLKEEVSLRPGPGGYDLVIAFSGGPVSVYRGRARVDRIGNCQEGLGNYLVIAMTDSSRQEDDKFTLDVVALIHELGHIFGAEHTEDKNSIMHEGFGYRTEFDLMNRGVILKNKFCAFGKGERQKNG